MLHRPSHWVLLVLVILAGLFTLREVSGQTSTNARAQFEGMPAMAGAQAGLGAQAGPPQGGIGAEGSDAAGLRLNRPRNVDEPRSVMRGEIARDPADLRPGLASADTALSASSVLPPVTPAPRLPQREATNPSRDTGIARDTGSTTRTAARSVKRAAKKVRFPALAQLS